MWTTQDPQVLVADGPPDEPSLLMPMSGRVFMRSTVRRRHDCTMQEHREAVLVFDRDGEVMAFPRLEDAAGWMESIDVLDGEYEGAFTPDGRLVEITGVRDGPVSLRITTEKDDIGLGDRLVRSRARMGFASDVSDPVSVANELMRREWELKWPRRPTWLRRRLRGDQPPQV
jgi:hypothetical protein